MPSRLVTSEAEDDSLIERVNEAEMRCIDFCLLSFKKRNAHLLTVNVRLVSLARIMNLTRLTSASVYTPTSATIRTSDHTDLSLSHLFSP